MKLCKHCNKPADIVESNVFYSCAKCWLALKRKPKEYNDDDDYYIIKSREWAKEKANG